MDDLPTGTVDRAIKELAPYVSRLPAPLAYGGLMLLAVILFAVVEWLSGTQLSTQLLVFLGVIILVPLTLFVFLDIKTGHTARLREIDRLQSKVRELEDEAEPLKDRLGSLESEDQARLREIQDLKKHVKDLEDEARQLVGKLASLESAPIPIPEVDGKIYDDKTIDPVLKELRVLHDQHRGTLPPGVLLPRLRRLFSRDTFSTSLFQCTSKNWTSRYRIACLTHEVVAAYSASAPLHMSKAKQKSYIQLQTKLNSYCDFLTGLFDEPAKAEEASKKLEAKVNEEVFAEQMPIPIPPEDISEKADKDCDELLEAISDAWAALGEEATYDPKEPSDD